MLSLSTEFLASPTLMVFLLLIILSIAFFGAIFYRPGNFQQTKLHVFITILAGFALSLIGLSLVLSALSYQKTLAIARVNMTKDAIDKLWLKPNQVLAQSEHVRPEFIRSLYYNNPHFFQNCEAKGKGDCTSFAEEQYIAILLIQSWEDFLTLRNFDKTGDRVWLTNFIQWAQSSYLKEYFNFLKYNFKNTTIQLGNLLFEYAKDLSIPTTNADDYYNIVTKILKDPHLKEIFKITEKE